MELSEMFEGAIETIETQGWCQGVPENDAGEVCIVGAFWHLDQGCMWEIAARTYLGEQLGLPMSNGFDGIPDWNDTPGRIKDEVIDALTTAAKSLRNEGR